MPQPSPAALRANFRQAINRVLQGDSIEIMRRLPAESVDLVIADPPYLVDYRERAGRRVANDSAASGDWLEPSTREIHRVLKDNRFFLSFYGWPQVDRFMTAWKQAGFRPVSHLVWTKPYPSKTGYTVGHHEVAYLLAKGRPPRPQHPPPDVNPWKDTRNRLHPTQKSVEVLRPLVRAFSEEAALILDPFAGSGSSAVAAARESRRFIAIEKDPRHCQVAERRLEMLRMTDPSGQR
jgi:adenine-specific DNA-methyltransferase